MWRGTAEPVVLQLGGRTVPSEAALQQGKTRGRPWLHGLRLQLPGKQGGAGGWTAERQRGSPLPHTAWSQLEALGGTKCCRVVLVLVQPHAWCEWDSCSELSAVKCSFHPSFCSSHDAEPSPSHYLQQPVALALSRALGSHCCLGRGLTRGDHVHGWHQTSYFNPLRNKT